MRVRTKYPLIVTFIIVCIAMANEPSPALVTESVLTEPESPKPIDLDSIFNEYNLKLKEVLNLTKPMLPSASSLLQSVAPETIPFVSGLDEVKIRVVDKEALSEKDSDLIREILAKFDEREFGPKGWKLVMKSDQKDNVTGVYARIDGEDVKGLFVYNGSSNMISIVNLMGKIDLSKISNLMLVGSKRHVYTPYGKFSFLYSPVIPAIEPSYITGLGDVFGVNRLKSTNTCIIDNDVVRIVVDNDRACVSGVAFKKGSNTELVDTWTVGNALFYLGSKDQKLRSGWKSDYHEVRSDSADFHFVKDGGYEATIKVKWSGEEIAVANEFTLPKPVAINNNINLITPGISTVGISTVGISTVSFGTPEVKKKLEEAKTQLEFELKSIPAPPAPPAPPQAIAKSLLANPLKAFWAVPAEKGVESGEYIFSGGRTGHYPKGKTMGKELFKPSEPWIAFWSQDRDETYGFTFSEGYEFSIESGSSTDFEMKIPQGKSEISFHVIKGKSSPEYEKIRALVKE